MINFIARHLVDKITEQLVEKQGILKHDGLYYFNDPIINGKEIINRVSRFYPYKLNAPTPISWFTLNGEVLVQVFKKLKNNEFFVYKKIEGKDCKVRIKKNVKQNIK